MANAEITVTIEQSMHAAIADLLQHYADERGILVHDLYVDWMDFSTIEKARFRTRSVRMRTEQRKINAPGS